MSKRYKERPGVILNKPFATLVVALDTSGSISTEELEVFVSELKHIARNGNRIYVIQCDYEIQDVQLFRGKIDKIKGRGGTSFIPVFEYVEKRRREMMVDGIIYFTDSFGDAPKTTTIPTLWVLTYGNKRPAEFGWSCELPPVEEYVTK